MKFNKDPNFESVSLDFRYNEKDPFPVIEEIDGVEIKDFVLSQMENCSIFSISVYYHTEEFGVDIGQGFLLFDFTQLPTVDFQKYRHLSNKNK